MTGHDPGPGHPERPARLGALLVDYAQRPIAGVTRVAPRPATVDELTAVHHPEHVEALAALGGQHAQIEADTRVSPGSWQAALLAAGGAVAAVEAVWSGRAQNAFVWARPPGHHAEASFPMGFCLFNNVAVAAAAGRRLGAERILIVDWDVHHGNGTQHIFEQRRDVLTMSAHQYPHYPGTGAPEEIGKGDGPRVHGQLRLACRADRRRLRAGVQSSLLADRRRVPPRSDAGLGGVRCPRRRSAGGHAALRTGFCGHVHGRAPRWPRPTRKGGSCWSSRVATTSKAWSDSSRACLEVLTGRNEEFPAGAARAASALSDSRAALAAHWRGWPADGSMPESGR